MKMLLFTAFLSCAMPVLKAQNSKNVENRQDSVAIAQVVEEYYFKGIYEGDVERPRPIFIPAPCYLEM